MIFIMQYLWLVPLGVFIGAFGTLIGAGGGFMLVPILLLVYPQEQPATLTAISLGVVCFNATSGSISYARMGRVDFRSGLLFLLTGIPGAIAGAYLVHYIPRHTFEVVFGCLMVAAGAFIFFRSYGPHERTRAGQMGFHRELIDAEGHRHEWSYNLAAGMTLSAFVGLASSILGIGGGIIHVPAMVSLLNFPVHFATATSHFILAAMSLAGTIEHIADGTLGRPQAARLVAIGLGAMVGAQIGARLSRRIHGRWIMKSLAVALGLVGVRILVAAAMSR